MNLAGIWRSLLSGHRYDRRGTAQRRRKPRRFVGLEPLESRQLLSVSLSLDNPTINENGGVANVTAALTAPLASPVTLDLTFGGTAVKGTDYSVNAESLTIPAGQTTAVAQISAINTALYEGDRTLTVGMTNVSGDSVGDTPQVQTTIIDDEAAPKVTLSLADSPMGEDGGVAYVYAFLSTPTNKTVTVSLNFSGTATLNGNYTASATQIVIAAGNTNSNIQLTGKDDGTYTGDLSFIVSIASVENATADGAQQVTGTIADAEAPAAVSLSLGGGSFSENGGTATVTATLTQAVIEDVTVNLAFAGTAVKGVRYQPSSTSITIAAGETSGSMLLTGVDDSIYEGAQSAVVSIGSVTNARTGDASQVTATITDDEGAPAVTLALASSTMAEKAGTDTVTATLSAAAGVDVTVNLTFGGTAVRGADYTASATSIAIPAGSTTATVTLTAIDNSVAGGNKTVVVGVDTAENATIGSAQQVTATIIDDESSSTTTPPDAPTALALAASSVLGGHAGFTATAAPTISLSAEGGKTVKVLVGGVAAATATEGAAGQYTATIPAGNLMVGANSITAVASDANGDSAASTALALTYAPSFTQLYVVPGAVGASESISVVVSARLASYSNEVGYIIADDATGAVGGNAPGSAGFAAAAMNKATPLFDGTEAAGDDKTITLPGGKYVIFYLVQNSTAANFLAANPSNALGGGPLAFFSADAANPDSVRHATTVGDNTTGNMQYCWEDLTGGGDSDFNDVVLSLLPSGDTGQTAASLLVAAASTETVAAKVTLGAGETSSEAIAENGGAAVNTTGSVAGEVGIFYVDDSSGSVGGVKPGDSGYAAAALAAANRQTLFAAGSSFGADNTVNLTGGKRIAFYAINTGSAADMLANNSTNSSSGSAVAFFSFDAANANSLNHFRWYGGELVSQTAPTVNSTSDPKLLHVMTSVSGGENDFSDFTLKVDMS